MPLSAAATPLFYDAVRCLFEGQDAVQRDVAAAAISKERVAVLRGKVLNADGKPLTGVRVSVLAGEAYGFTRTRDNGDYDVVVHGGGVITLRFEREGHLSAQRQSRTQWRAFSVLEDLVLLARAEPLATVDIGKLGAPQLLRSKPSRDKDGERQHAVLFVPGTKA